MSESCLDVKQYFKNKNLHVSSRLFSHVVQFSQACVWLCRICLMASTKHFKNIYNKFGMRMQNIYTLKIDFFRDFITICNSKLLIISYLLHYNIYLDFELMGFINNVVLNMDSNSRIYYLHAAQDMLHWDDKYSDSQTGRGSY